MNPTSLQVDEPLIQRSRRVAVGSSINPLHTNPLAAMLAGSAALPISGTSIYQHHRCVLIHNKSIKFN